jgi:predicted CXXCH cytochrome family protein
MRLTRLTTVLTLAAIVGCSVTARERLKHFFFEVPEEPRPTTAGDSNHLESVVAVEAKPEFALPPGRFVSIHEPFRSHDCQACHDASKRMKVDSAAETTCGACHDRYFGEEVGHGPVAAGECLLCHDPHRSAFPALLTTAIGENCAQCHEASNDLSQPAHAGSDAAHCTQCHDPHFGAPPLLKPGIARPSEAEKG